MVDGASVPLVTFHQFIPGARPPQRADRSAAGLIPTRAFRYCEALTTASSLGWYVFSPLSFSLLWDGDEISWSFQGAQKWYTLSVAQFPNFRRAFDEIVPDRIKSYSPPFLATLPEPGLVQIWSGLVARTRPGYSLMVRPPVNMPRGRGYDLFEGVVETDQWFGPLFTNIRLTRTPRTGGVRHRFAFVPTATDPAHALQQRFVERHGHHKRPACAQRARLGRLSPHRGPPQPDRSTPGRKRKRNPQTVTQNMKVCCFFSSEKFFTSLRQTLLDETQRCLPGEVPASPKSDTGLRDLSGQFRHR